METVDYECIMKTVIEIGRTVDKSVNIVWNDGIVKQKC
mgnify:CR=1 FL=1